MVNLDKTWICSDPHLNHGNIIKYCNRPFKSVNDMNEEIINRHNSVVDPTDTVFILGDLGWPDPSEYVKKLNGNKILIRGNHDSEKVVSSLLRNNTIIGPVHDYFELTLKEYGILPIVMCHYPIESWNRKYHGAIHLHGHTHGTLDNSGLMRFDMGIDCNDYYPFKLKDVLRMAEERLTELGGKEGIRGNLGDKETYGLKEQVRPIARDSKMQELYKLAEEDVDKFLEEHRIYKEFYESRQVNIP